MAVSRHGKGLKWLEITSFPKVFSLIGDVATPPSMTTLALQSTQSAELEAWSGSQEAWSRLSVSLGCD